MGSGSGDRILAGAVSKRSVGAVGFLGGLAASLDPRHNFRMLYVI